MKKIRHSSAAWFVAANYDEADPRRTERNALLATEEEIASMLVLSRTLSGSSRSSSVAEMRE